MGFGGGKDELDMGGRLFKGLQQGIKGARGEHVHFVNDEYLETAAGRKILDRITQVPDVIHTGIGSAVDFKNIHRGACGNFAAGGTGIAGFRRRPPLPARFTEAMTINPAFPPSDRGSFPSAGCASSKNLA